MPGNKKCGVIFYRTMTIMKQSYTFIWEDLMKLFKRLTILFTLLLVTACSSLNAIIGKEQSEQQKPLPELTRSLEHKTMPERYVIEPISDINIEAEAAMLMNGITGDVLFDKNIHESLAVASMSKIMTELLVLEAIEEGKISWEDTVMISDYAFTISNHPGFASVHLQQDQDYTVQELFHAMAIRSANDATIALAELVSGSEKEFVMLMNKKAEQLELNDSYFVNSTGLTNEDLQNNHSTGSISDKNMMSAEDLAKLAKYIIDHYPQLLEITKMQEFIFQNETYTNSNWMLPGLQVDLIEEDVTFEGVDGLKTGFTDDAGYGFTGTVQIKDIRFISVIIGTKEIENRFLETNILYDAVLQQLETR